MFRRSRFSIRPNVGTAGRTAATPQEAPSSNQESSETPKDISESIAVTDVKSDGTPSEKTTAPVDGNDQNAEGAISSAAVQRRKRFSVKPKVAPGRPSALARTSRSLAKADTETPVETPASDLEKPSASIQTGTTSAPQGLQSPRRRRRSEESKQPKAQPKPAPDSSEPSAVLLPEDSLEQTHLPVDSGLQLKSKSGSQVEEVPPRPPDKVLFSIPDREAVELSERAKSLVSSKSGHSLSQSALSLSRLLNDPSDLQRLAKAQKLRELLRQEKHKEKKLKKIKPHVKEYTLDPTKMTMRDLIHYLPLSNPMTSTVEDITQENETVLPPSPAREPSPEKVPEPEAPPELPSTVEDEEEMAEEEDDSLMVPQVKVAEDGSLIIDEESLTVEVQRAKGPNPAQDRDPIFERGSTTTYSSFRRSSYSKPWSSEETEMFYLSVSMVGTDFSMICQLFPHRARSEIKNKFKKEERENSWRIDKAFRERRKLDIEYFSKLLEKILEVQQNRKKLKTLVKKNSPKNSKRKAKGKKAESTLSDLEEENEDDANEVPNLEDEDEEEEEEEEGEKEKENLCNEGGTPVSKPKKQRKRKAKQAAVNEEANDKKKKTGEKSNEQGEACIPEDPEATLAEDQTTPAMSEKTENVNASKDTAIKPAKLSRGRAPKPLLPLGRKWSKKLPPDSTKAKDTASDKEDESVTDEASEEQVNQDSSALREDDKRKSDDVDISSEEEDVTAPPPKPTRYGRVPKPTNLLNYPAKEEPTSASNSSPASPVMSAASAAKPKPKCTAKRGRSSKQQSAQQSKKPKLVTLRTSRSDFSDDDEEQQDQEEVEEEEYPLCSPGEDSTAPVFVPASLRSPHPVISEVEETMEELDILANMPDVLGLSQDVLCPDSSFELAHTDTGSAEPCEHQLDLLVDVIDFLSSEHPEVTEDESYNEAAQTLLTIGNLTQLSEQSQIVTEDHTTGTTSVSAEEMEQHQGDADQEENCEIHIMFDHGDTEISEMIATVEPQQGTTDSGDAPMVEASEQSCGGQKTVSYTDFGPQLQSSPESAKKQSPQTRKGRLSKVKPKPNLGRGSRTEQPKPRPDTSTEQTAGGTNIEASNIQVTESLSAPEETTPKILENTPTSSIDDDSSTKVKHTEEMRVTQDRSGAAALDQSASEHQSHCFSDAQLETRDTISDQKLKSHAEIIQSFSSNLATSETSDSVPVHEGSQHPAAFVTPVDDVPVGQKEKSEAASTSQIKRGRSQKVKPKPILAQTSRTARSKPQTTKATVQKDASPAPDPQIHENTREVEPEATSSTCPENPSQSTGPAAALIPSFDLGSTHTPAIELSTAEEKRTVGGLDQSVSQNQILSEPCNRNTGSTSGSTDEKMATCDDATESRDNPATSVTVKQVGQDCAPVKESSDHPASSVTPVDAVAVSQKEKSEAASSGQIKRGRSQKVKPKPILAETSRTARILSEPSNRETAPTSGSTNEKMATCDGTAESSDNLVTSDSAFTKSQVGQDSAPKISDHPASSVTPVDDVPVSQKEESEAASTSQIKRGRSQKVKPKPILAQTTRTARSKPQTTEDSEKYFSPTPVPKVNEKTKEESEAICGTSDEKPSHSTGPASVLVPLFDLGSALTATQELSTTEERRTADSLVGQVYLQNQSISETSYINTGSTSGSTDDTMATGDAASVQESTDHPASFVITEDLPVSQKEEGQVASTSQIRRGRAQKIKPKPNLAATSRTARSKLQTTKDPVMQVQLVETPSSPTVKPQSTKKTTAEMEAPRICSISLPIQSTDTATVSVPSLELCSTHKPSEESYATMEQQTEVGLNSILKSSEPNVPHRRQQFSKVKPNLGSSTKTTRIKVQPKTIIEPSVMDTSSNVASEPSPVDNSQTEVKLIEEDLKVWTSSQGPLNTDLSLNKSVPAESEKPEATSSDGIVMATSCVADNQPLLPDTITEGEIREVSTFERKSTGGKMSNNDSVEAGPASQVPDPITASESQSPEGGSTESKISSVLATNVFSITTVHPTESYPQSCPESDSEVKSQDAAQQCSETRETHQTSKDKTQTASRTELELTDSSKSTKKGPQSRRGRLIIPKPNLGRSSRPQQPQQVRSPAQAQADTGAQSESLDASVSLNPVSELPPDIPDPIGGAVESHSHQESCPNDAQSLLVTSEPMPPGSDIPFFILSLSEIPVCSSGELMDSAAGHLPYLQDGDAPIQQLSVPGESLAPADDTSLSNVPVSMRLEGSSEMGFLGVKDDEQDSAVSVMENPEDPQETVQPPTLPEIVENNAKTETHLAKKRISGAGRRAKVQVKPNTTKKTQASKTVAANTNQESGLPGPSTQTEASDAKTTAGKVGVAEPQERSGEHGDIGKETLSVGESPEDGSPRAQTKTKTRRMITRARKPDDFPSFLSDANTSDPPCGKAASKGPKVQTPRTGKHSTSTPAASTFTVAPSPGQTEQPQKLSRSTSSTTSPALTNPSTSQCTAEVSAPQQGDCVESSATEVEPTSVSQYFLSDIFTEVE
ncbi:transcription factor TFIIIB component B'' homolog [Platichthys flesus]|uniref:transcription factor TFIIIB component B'' homolog n=1 Tax=Platichthys flesus TaxID=8260 RepID=UPI002DB8AEFE|nr:transcription factor TFIIIB component B'' homolog [Platichthys flesus]